MSFDMERSKRNRARLDRALSTIEELTVTTSQAAQLRGVKKRSITQATWEGRLRAIPLTPERRYLRDDVVGEAS